VLDQGVTVTADILDLIVRQNLGVFGRALSSRGASSWSMDLPVQVVQAP
jgi:hypothetical protein